MSSAAVALSCCCGSLSDTAVLCHEHHRYHWKGRELDSVTRVLKSCWPVKADYSSAPPEVLENARERGAVLDSLFSDYVVGKLSKIPAGTRSDAVDLFMRLKQWWDVSGYQGRSQVILHDEHIAGSADVITSGGWILDVKGTYNIEPMYQLQLGLYALLFEYEFKEAPAGLGIVHVTARYDKPRLVNLDVKQCMTDAAHIRDVWMMAKRRTR